jgi:hypothetical protein
MSPPGPLPSAISIPTPITVSLQPEPVSFLKRAGSYFTKVLYVLLAVLLIPWLLARVSDVGADRKEELRRRTDLGSRLNGDLTDTVVHARLFAANVLPAQGESVTQPPEDLDRSYGALLSSWLAKSSEYGSEIATSFGDSPCDGGSSTPKYRVQCNWLDLFASVTDYLRLSSGIERFDRGSAALKLKDFLSGNAGTDNLDFSKLADRSDSEYFTIVTIVGDALLSARDAYAKDLRSVKMNGFQLSIIGGLL